MYDILEMKCLGSQTYLESTSSGLTALEDRIVRVLYTSYRILTKVDGEQSYITTREICIRTPVDEDSAVVTCRRLQPQICRT
jgi:hypothetical protein